MTDSVFAKTYQDPRRATAAHAHLRWLAGLNSGIRMPQLRSAEPRRCFSEVTIGSTMTAMLHCPTAVVWFSHRLTPSALYINAVQPNPRDSQQFAVLYCHLRAAL